MSEAGKLAEELNEKLDALHDSVISRDPFYWSDADGDRKRRETIFSEISEKLRNFIYVSKKKVIVKILLFGTALPLALIAVLYFLNILDDQNTRLYISGGLGLIALMAGIIAAIIADDADIGSDLALAVYTIPKGWSFSRMNQEDIWNAYIEQFGFFNRGDENQYIGTRIWGYVDSERKWPFQLFHFHYDTVYHVPVTRKIGNSTITTMERRVTPHNYYGMFLAMPESKTHFRITEIGGDAGTDSHIKFEYDALNKATDIYCNAKDELAVRQFLSPAVQEEIMNLSNNISGMHFDFYPGLALIITNYDFFDEVSAIELDKHTANFMENVRPAEDKIEKFRNRIVKSFKQIRKYND